jgi:GT2 family glycosyltransferase
MKVSVIIPSFNGAGRLPSLLSSLKRQVKSADEIIVVLDGSSDNSEEILVEWKTILPLRVIKQDNKGRAGARNSGAELALHEILIFYDDDMDVEKNSIQKHLDAHRQYKSIVVAGQQLELESDSEFSRYKAWLTKRWVRGLGKEGVILSVSNLFLTAANMSIRKIDFKALGGFDKRLKDAEDFDLAARAHVQGIGVYYDPKNLAYHASFDTFKDYTIRQRQYRLGHKILWSLRKNESYSSIYRKYQVKLSKFNAIIYYFVSPHLLKWADRGYFGFLPVKLRYNIFQRLITALTVYYPNRKL